MLFCYAHLSSSLIAEFFFCSHLQQVADVLPPSVDTQPAARDERLGDRVFKAGWMIKEGANVKSWKRRYLMMMHVGTIIASDLHTARVRCGSQILHSV